MIRIAESLFPGRLVEQRGRKARQVFNMSHAMKTIRWLKLPVWYDKKFGYARRQLDSAPMLAS